MRRTIIGHAASLIMAPRLWKGGVARVRVPLSLESLHHCHIIAT